ncbi:LamG-like jellyroll fold domain-containing protein [Sulfuriroseicoccus oceanibius]|uniref:FecR domain-containing protein n=1 Tax=Sulfuriroseicoccus oceanibius TaxID=2707525 RepID=A0A6B3LDH2_9BACT|nr:LamG-like jellyroll fold domain-containing protein [Sulfuriroseicoccus oceanibius]QQL45861.1 FecR domain-containing protein [Sulfuriroseicoccus oceanibius]
MNLEELELLVGDLLDGSLSGEKRAELEAALMASPEARERFSELLQLHNAMEIHTEGLPSAKWGRAVIPVERVMRRQRRKIMRIAVMAAAAVIVLGAVVMRMIHVPHAAELAGFEVARGTRFEVTHAVDRANPTGGALHAGSRMVISQGAVELKFESGVRSVVQAPADLTLDAEGVVSLDEGVAWFHVPADAVGFEVVAREVRIVDLGTEFGVVSSGMVADEVHVFDGRVAVTHLWGGDSTRRELVAGEAVRATDEEELEAQATDRSRFTSVLPDGLPYLHWSFDGADPFQVRGTYNAVSRIKTGDVAGLSNPELVPGVVGNAVVFNGERQALVTNWPGFTGKRARTVSFWMRLPAGVGQSGLNGIVGWGDPELYGGKWKVLVCDGEEADSQVVRVSWGAHWADGSIDVNDGEWHHVVVTTTGQVDAAGHLDIAVYVDGVRDAHRFEGTEESGPVHEMRTGSRTQAAQPLMFGSSLQSRIEDRFFFKGEIDELFIHAGHVTAEEVARMRELSGAQN